MSEIKECPRCKHIFKDKFYCPECGCMVPDKGFWDHIGAAIDSL